MIFMPELLLGLSEVQRELASGRKLPPVTRWDPAHCGTIDIRILRDGTWLHQGMPIHRLELVRLFSTILRKEDEAFYLVTPIEKMRIEVEDAPFVATLLDVQQRDGTQELVFTTNVGDVVTAGREHRLRVGGSGMEGNAPYIDVRAGLEARISRNVFYQMVDLAVLGPDEYEGVLGIWSSGSFFPLGSN